jgi:hypothetical protein
MTSGLAGPAAADRAAAPPIHWQTLAALLAFGALTVVLWSSVVLLPLKLLVVLVHEIWHALAAIATGGKVDEIRLSADQSGLTLARGGSYVVVASAGYVGSSLTGAALLWASARPRLAPLVLGLLGTLVLLMTILYVPLRNPFGLAFGLLSGVLLLVVAVWHPRALILGVMGLAVMCCLYSVYDFGDYLLGDASRTDAGLLAAHLRMPFLALPIGVGWSLLSLWILVKGLVAACRKRDDHLVRAAQPPERPRK